MANLDIKDILNLPLKIQFAVVAVVCAFILYIGYQWDISNLKRQLVSAQSQEADLKTKLEIVTALVAQMNADIAQLPQLQALVKQWQSQLTPSRMLSDLLNNILSIGTTNQLQFQMFNPGSAARDKDHPEYEKVPIKIVIIGEYNSIVTLISQLANMAALVEIEDFEISRGADKLYDKKEAEQPGYATSVTIRLTLNVYRLAEAPLPITLPKKGKHAK